MLWIMTALPTSPVLSSAIQPNGQITVLTGKTGIYPSLNSTGTIFCPGYGIGPLLFAHKGFAEFHRAVDQGQLRIPW